MKKIEDYIENALRSNSTELRISVDGRPQSRSKNGWHKISEDITDLKWVNEQFFSLLEEQEQTQLLERGVIAGVFPLNKDKNKKIQFVISKSSEGFHGHFQWSDQKISYNDFSLPGAVLEVAKKSNGLNLVTGPRRCGKSTLLQALSEEILKTSFLSIAVFSDKVMNTNSEQITSFPIEVLLFDQDVTRGFDIVIIDSLKISAWRQGLALAESGVQVIMALPFQSTEAAISRLGEKVEAQASIGISRVIACLQMSIGLRLILSTEKGKQIAYELLFVTRDVRKALKAGDWEQVEILMSSLGEKTGMRTLNQCLMNLMLTRRIDLNSGFSESPRPDELDKMLEKVGF